VPRQRRWKGGRTRSSASGSDCTSCLSNLDYRVVDAAGADPVAAVPVDCITVPLVVVPPLASVPPAVLPFVTGAPVPVSVAVVPVDGGWIVSVEPTVLSAGFRLHATERVTAATNAIDRLSVMM